MIYMSQPHMEKKTLRRTIVMLAVLALTFYVGFIVMVINRS